MKDTVQVVIMPGILVDATTKWVIDKKILSQFVVPYQMDAKQGKELAVAMKESAEQMTSMFSTNFAVNFLLSFSLKQMW